MSMRTFRRIRTATAPSVARRRRSTSSRLPEMGGVCARSERRLSSLHMPGIFNGVIRFMNLKRGIAAIEIEGGTAYCVVELHEGEAEIGDQLVGNLDEEGAVDLFNRTRHDRINGMIRSTGVT